MVAPDLARPTIRGKTAPGAAASTSQAHDSSPASIGLGVVASNGVERRMRQINGADANACVRGAAADGTFEVSDEDIYRLYLYGLDGRRLTMP